MPGVSVTWLGHAAFRIDSPGGKRVYLDPWLSNPSFPEGEPEPERMDVMAITHGHSDHLGEAVELGKRFSPRIVAIFELASWLESQGVANAGSGGMNKGGTQDVDGIRFTMTNAVHSSGFSANGDPVYLGEPAGFVIEFENGTKLYFAGDTAVMSDMQLIGRLYEPDAAVLPIGDYFTMGPREVALAVELLGVHRILASHYGTFPLLSGTPEECRKLVGDCEVLAPRPGETIEL
ncbi:MAG: metal-dependent hydrolase [Actinomycetota bacterium]|nr:metal-dependent hydrolase [Actinomycetota bacterium]